MRPAVASATRLCVIWACSATSCAAEGRRGQDDGRIVPQRQSARTELVCEERKGHRQSSPARKGAASTGTHPWPASRPSRPRRPPSARLPFLPGRHPPPRRPPPRPPSRSVSACAPSAWAVWRPTTGAGRAPRETRSAGRLRSRQRRTGGRSSGGRLGVGREEMRRSGTDVCAFRGVARHRQWASASGETPARPSAASFCDVRATGGHQALAVLELRAEDPGE